MSATGVTQSIAPQIVLEQVCKAYGDHRAVVDVNLTIQKGEMFALVGGSGCGKTTLLRMLAGFVVPTQGRILIDGKDMAGVQPHQREVNMMFQSYALFPHMSVAENVGYGLKRSDLAPAIRAQRVAEALKLVQMETLGSRRPQELSGGQRQRVALARALIRRPQVLLLDEPLSALDKNLREQTQFELIHLQQQLGITFVFVTHDQDEAMALASRIAVMNAGEVLQVATPTEIYECPKTRFVAQFIGTTNIIEGISEGSERDAATIDSPALGGPVAYAAQRPNSLSSRQICCSLRPERIRLSRQRKSDGAANEFAGVVTEIGYLGGRSTYRVRVFNQVLSVVAQNDDRQLTDPLQRGEHVYVRWDPAAAVLLEG